MEHNEIVREFFHSIRRVKRTPDRLPQRESTEMMMKRVRRAFSPSQVIRGDRYILVKKTATHSA